MDDTNTNPIPPADPVSPTPPVPPVAPISPAPEPVAPTSIPTPVSPTPEPTPTPPQPSQPTPPNIPEKIESKLFSLAKIYKIIAAVFVIIVIIIIIIVIVAVNVARSNAEETNTANPSDSSTMQSETNEPAISDELDTTTTITDFISYQVPDGFIESSEATDSYHSYYYPEDDDSIRGSCSFIVNMPTGYDDATAVLEQALNELFPDAEDSDVLPQIKSSKIHGHTWRWFSNSAGGSDNYYYATDFADHTFYMEFDSGIAAPSECPGFRTTIINSLQMVDQPLI